MSFYPNHDWRADEYTLIRGNLHANVGRAWCADDRCSTAWHWYVYRDDDQLRPPEGVQEYGFPTAEAAQQAAEAFMASLDETEQYRRAASFVGVPVPGEEVPL